MTIAEELAESGYGYRASLIAGRREVYHTGTGQIVGQFTAADAIAFLDDLPRWAPDE